MSAFAQVPHYQVQQVPKKLDKYKFKYNGHS